MSDPQDPAPSPRPSGRSKRTRTRYPGVYTLPSGLVQAIWREPGGRQRSTSRPGWTPKQAHDYRQAVLADLARGTYQDPERLRVPFGDWADYWWEQRRVQPTTAAKDWSRLQTHILPAFGTTPIGRIDPTAVRGWVRALEAAGLARATVQGIYALFCQIMTEAADADLIGRSPCRGIRFDPQAPEPRQPWALSTAEAARLLEALAVGSGRAGAGDAAVPAKLPVHGATPYTLVLTALGTGLRWGELTGLRRRNVHLLRRPPYLEVVESLHEAGGRLWFGPPKTTSSRRRVPLPPTVARALAAHLPTGGDPDDLVFTTPHGRPWRRRNWATGRWIPALTAAGLDGLHFHDTRSTYSSWLADAGIPEVIIAAVLGHKLGRSTTAGYIGVITGFEDRVLAAVEERLSAAEGAAGVGG